MTRRVWLPTRRIFHAALLAALALGACGEPSAVGPSVDPSFAKGGGGGGGSNPVVNGTSPTWGNPGESHKLVRVLGSGFDATAAVTFERNGVADPDIVTHATRFISSSELEAEISISGGAELALYDVSVQLYTAGGPGKKGIALMTFELTLGFGQATAFWPNSMNDAGQVVAGGSVWQQVGFGWQESVVDAGATVWDIDEAGTLVVGTKGAAVVWTRSGSSWTAATLPAFTGKGAGGMARGVATVSGTPFVVGHSNESAGRNQTVTLPVLWRPSGTSWARTDLPLGGATTGLAHDVNPAGTIVGNAGGGVVWERDAFGNYQVTALPGGANSPAFHINDAGTMIVGFDNGANVPVSWTKTGGSWGAATPFATSGGCTAGGQYALGVNDQGWAVGRICVGNKFQAVLWRGPAAGFEELGGASAMAIANADGFGVVRIAGHRAAASPGKVEGIVWALPVAP